MSEPGLVDITGRLRSPAATPGHWRGCAPPNKGRRYPADPPTVEEIILVMREAGSGPYADRVVGSSRSCGAPACGSAKPWRSPNPIWIRKPGQCWSAPARAGSEGWSGWTTGLGSTFVAGQSTASSCRSARCSASSPARPAGGAGQRPPRAASFADSLPRLECGVGSRRTSSVMRTRSRWRTKGSRCRLSRGSSGMRTSASRRFISKESIQARSLTQFTTADRR